MPSRAARGFNASLISPKPVSTSHSALFNAALSRLTSQEYEILREFKREFPRLELEKMRRVTNAFMLFRSWYVGQEPPQGNQAVHSQEAANLWNKDYTDAQKAPFVCWFKRIRALWRKMYPNGFPLWAIPKKQRPKKSSSKSIKAPPSHYSPSPSTSSSRNFQPLPSPPISDAAEFEDNIMEDIDEEEVSYGEGFSGDSSDDEEYIPKKPSQKGRPQRLSSQKRAKPQLLTPVSITRELSPIGRSRSPSPIPVFSDSDSSPSSSPAIPDVSLLELNGEGPSTFTTSSIPPAPASPKTFHLRDPSEFFEQIAVGYSFEEHANNTIMDWDQTDLMPNLDPVGLYPVMNLPCSSDAIMAALTDDLGNQLIIDELLKDDC